MYERGIRFRLLETYFRLTSVMCLEKVGASKDPLGFNDVYTAFVILLLGHALSLSLLMLERVFPPEDFFKENANLSVFLLQLKDELLSVLAFNEKPSVTFPPSLNMSSRENY